MIVFELGIVAALIVVNGLLAMSELAVVSSRPARLKLMVERGVVGSRRALVLASDPGKFLSTVQIGITLVGVLSGAFSGATLGERLSTWLMDNGLSEVWADTLGFGVVVVAITYASLIVGELVPKQIALRDPESVAVKVAPAMTWVATLSSPVVFLLDVSGRALLRLLGHQAEAEERVTEDEIKHLIAEAESAGVLEPGEREMIAGVLRLGDRPVRAVMTPRHAVDMVDVDSDIVAARALFASSGHSRLPVYDGTPEEVIGVLQAKDLLNLAFGARPESLRELVKPAPVVPDTADALDVVDILKASPMHLGLVHDEYGVFQGVVTSADILGAIIGALRSEDQPAEAHVVRRDDGSLLISGTLAVDEMAERIGIPLPEDRAYHTVAGFMLDAFGHLPAVGERFDAHGWRFEVVDLDGRRIDKVLVARAPSTHRVG